MKITFAEGGYIEITATNDKVLVVIQAQDATDTLKSITNTCELTTKQFQDLCASLDGK